MQGVEAQVFPQPFGHSPEEILAEATGAAGGTWEWEVKMLIKSAKAENKGKDDVQGHHNQMEIQ